MLLQVVLNGTDVNPYTKYGLTQNPFPQIASAEHQEFCLHLQKLGADPIPNCAYIRRHLQGWDGAFVDLLCDKFRPGQIVRFWVKWKD